MYINPLTNEDISEISSIKNKSNVKKIVKSYNSKKLKQGEPTELMKYYEYMTYKQPIIDEAIYVAERMKTENIEKQKADYEFIQKLKEKRALEIKKKETSQAKQDLFDIPNVKPDITPVINSDLEIKFPKEYTDVMKSLVEKGNVQLVSGKDLGYSRKELEKMQRKSTIQKAILSTQPSTGDNQSLTRQQLEQMKQESQNKKEKSASKIQALLKGVAYREKVLPSLLEQSLVQEYKRGRGRPLGSKDTQPRKSRLPEVPQAISNPIQEAIPLTQTPTAPELPKKKSNLKLKRNENV